MIFSGSSIKKRNTECISEIDEKEKIKEKEKEKIYPPFKTGGQPETKEDRKNLKPIVHM